MGFLAEDKKDDDIRGRTITTMQDLFRMGRKVNIKPVVVEQNATDFDNNKTFL